MGNGSPSLGIATRIWRRVAAAPYASAMGIARRDKGRRYSPVGMPSSLAMYEGLWVAVLDGKIVAAANTSRELVGDLAKLGPAGRGATMQRVPAAERGLMVGLG